MRKVFIFSSNDKMEFNINDIIKYENDNDLSLSKYFNQINRLINLIMLGNNEYLSMSKSWSFHL